MAPSPLTQFTAKKLLMSCGEMLCLYQVHKDVLGVHSLKKVGVPLSSIVSLSLSTLCQRDDSGVNSHSATNQALTSSDL